jgi:hypothetical protein
MKFSFAQAILFALCSLAVVTVAMPSHYYMDADVEVRALPISEADMLEARRGGIGDVVEMIVNVVGKIKAAIARDKTVGLLFSCHPCIMLTSGTLP